MGKGTLGHVGKAQPPESRGKKREKKRKKPYLPGLRQVGREMSNNVGDYSCHSALPPAQGRGANVSFCVHLDLVSLWFLPEDQFLCIYLVSPVGAWRYKCEQKQSYLLNSVRITGVCKHRNSQECYSSLSKLLKPNWSLGDKCGAKYGILEIWNLAVSSGLEELGQHRAVSWNRQYKKEYLQHPLPWFCPCQLDPNV